MTRFLPGRLRRVFGWQRRSLQPTNRPRAFLFEAAVPRILGVAAREPGRQPRRAVRVPAPPPAAGWRGTAARARAARAPGSREVERREGERAGGVVTWNGNGPVGVPRVRPGRLAATLKPPTGGLATAWNQPPTAPNPHGETARREQGAQGRLAWPMAAKLHCCRMEAMRMPQAMAQKYHPYMLAAGMSGRGGRRGIEGGLRRVGGRFAGSACTLRAPLCAPMWRSGARDPPNTPPLNADACRVLNPAIPKARKQGAHNKPAPATN
jgi:hypothetical protein